MCTSSASIGTATATDNCTSTVSHSPTGPYNVGNTTVTWIATDASGNTATCSQTVIVTDNQVPVITCPATAHISTDAGMCTSSASIGTATATDNCTATVSHSPTGPYNVGNTTVTWIATDASGNTATCSQTVIVTDNQIPVITCPATAHINTDAGMCTSSASIGTATATDNCSATVSHSPSGPYAIGNTIVTWKAIDASGNTATCSQTVTVTDNQAPVITCPSTANISTDAGMCTSSASIGTAIATDNCSATVSHSPAGPYNVGNTTVIWTATDASGNTATCSQIVHVTDNQAPVITCPSNMTVSVSSGCSTVVTFTVTASDNCGNPTIVSSPASGSSLFSGTTTVMSTATDAHGNTSTCSFTITVIGALPAQPGAITGNTDVCQSASENYSIAPVSGATSYTWTLPSGWTGTSTTTTMHAHVGASSGTISVSANNTCGSGLAQTLAVVSHSGAPSQPGTITGNVSICQSSVQTYSIASVSGATGYIWTLPGSWTGSSTSTSITVTVGNSNGDIKVKANNACGSSANSTLAISVNGAPNTPGAIAGSNNPCSGTSQTYSIFAVSGATSYTWTLPSGWIGTSTTTSILATVGNSNGTISVVANGNCGTSPSNTLSLTVNQIPAQPGSITGNTAVCNGTSQNYSVVAVSGATGYAWTLPSGWPGNSNNRTINATAGPSGGTITITANNTCGSSSSQSLAVTSNSIPAQPGAISGNVSVCKGVSQTYSISTVAGATSYNWNLPGSWSGTSSTNSITCVPGNNNGNITVNAVNGCGNSANQSIAVTSNSVNQVSVSSNPSDDNFCAEISPTSVTLTASAGYNSYAWSPSGGNSRSAIVNSVNTYTVTASGAGGCTTTASISVTSNCALPTNLNTGHISGNSAIASWNISTCAIYYTVRISVHGLNSWTQYIATGSSYTFAGLSLGTAYDWQIETDCNTSGTVNSGWSATQTFTTHAHRMEEEVNATGVTFNVYPNPANGLVTIAFSSMEEVSYNVKLIDMMGRVVKSEIGNAGLGENTFVMNLDGLAKGVYTVILQKGDNISKAKLVVE